jgi:hypothetical protein
MNPEIRTAKNWYRWLWLSPFLTIPTLALIGVSVYGTGYGLICSYGSRDCPYELVSLVSYVAAILGSAWWHLVLLIPATHRQSEFVRWHGRQALLLAGVRTAVPLAFVLFNFVSGGYGFLSLYPILGLIAVWLFGTSWGQGQAARGDCALMRWAGHGAGLPLPVKTATPASTPALTPIVDEKPEHRTAYYRGLSLQEQGQTDAAARLFRQLLVSDATPALKARAADQLKALGATASVAGAEVLVEIVRFGSDPEQRRAALAELERLGWVEAL